MLEKTTKYRLHVAGCIFLVVIVPFLCLSICALCYRMGNGVPVGRFFGVVVHGRYVLVGHERVLFGRSPAVSGKTQIGPVMLRNDPFRTPESRSVEGVDEINLADLGSSDNYRSMPGYLPLIASLVLLAAGLNSWPANPRYLATPWRKNRRGFTPLISNPSAKT